MSPLYSRHEKTEQTGYTATRGRSTLVRAWPRRVCVTGLEAGERIFEYKGETIEWTAAIRQHESTGTAGHTYFFGLSDGRVIDGGRGGNSARWLNHSCNANCEALEVEDRVFIHASTAIAPGEELFLDYQLVVDEPADEGSRLSYVCRCGALGCRGTMLAVAAS